MTKTVWCYDIYQENRYDFRTNREIQVHRISENVEIILSQNFALFRMGYFNRMLLVTGAEFVVRRVMW